MDSLGGDDTLKELENKLDTERMLMEPSGKSKPKKTKKKDKDNETVIIISQMSFIDSPLCLA